MYVRSALRFPDHQVSHVRELGLVPHHPTLLPGIEAQSTAQDQASNTDQPHHQAHLPSSTMLHDTATQALAPASRAPGGQ